MKRKNEDVREYAKSKGVYNWQIAEKMGVTEMTISRLYRVEIPPKKRAQMIAAIDEIAAENAAEKNSGV